MNGNKYSNKLGCVLLLLVGRFFYYTAKKEKNMKILIGTKNPGKIKGATQALDNYFTDYEMVSVNAPSLVADQPVNDDTYLGAHNRVQNLIKYAKENNISADFFMAVESGIVKHFGKWFITNVAVICDKYGYESVGTSASFPVPEKYVESIIKNTLGTVMDEIFSKHDLRSSTGGIGLLTHDAVTRIDLNTQAFNMALTQFVNGDIWADENLVNEL